MKPAARRPTRLLVAVALLSASMLWAARDDERIGQLKEEIRTVEGLMADSANVVEKPRLQHRLEMLQQELSILEKRQELENQERGLRAGQSTAPREQLRERLNSVPPDTSALDAQLRELSSRRATVMNERDALNLQLAALPKAVGGDAAASARRAQVEEKLYNANEKLRAVALQQEAVEIEIDLVRQAQALRERVRAAETRVRPSLHALFTGRMQARGESAVAAQLKERIANHDESLRNSEAALGLAQQKLAKFDEELQMLERQTNFLRRNPQVEQFLASERAQKELLGERLPFLAEQVAALRQSREALQTRLDLLGLEGVFLREQAEEMQADYLHLLYAPAIIAAIIIGIHTAVSRLLLPKRYKKEELFLARRLGRYGVALLIALVTAFYLIEDLSVLATTLGLVSAAIVISIQDLLASFFGWFAIMPGRKFTVGDRLEIEGVRGDVLDIQILRTTLVEVNNWLGVDQPTGRVLFIPNNFIFKSKVFNFSHGHPYIWGKIEVTVTYGTPTASAMALFSKVLEEETREDFAAARRAAAEMERRYGVEDAEYRPKIYTRIADSGVTFSLIYVCHYRASSSTRNRINRRLIAELETHKHIQLAYNTLTVIPSVAATDAPSAVLGHDATQAPFVISAKQH
jgi:small-conductance mechanosensitive channel